MLLKTLIAASAVLCCATPAMAQDVFAGARGKPKPITHFEVANKSIELVAVTRRARADTRVHRAYMKESIAMSKAMPGYPQPALLSFDMRMKF